MLRWSWLFLLLAVTAGVVGFLLAVWLVKVLFFLFCALFVISLIRRRREPARLTRGSEVL